MLALEASLRNVKTLLIEQHDYGAHTSYNSLRILHGGFRYLQNFDLRRLYESARERFWYFNFFPELTHALPSLMPLYGNGLRRPQILGPALKAYDVLTGSIRNGANCQQIIPTGRMLGAKETINQCCFFPEKGLQGGAVWYDGFIPDTQRLLIGALRWGCEYGLQALNYVRATDIVKHRGKTVGLLVQDEETNSEYQFDCELVVNAAGPWCRDVATHFDQDEPLLFHSMLAWNVLFNRPAISHYATAVSSPGPLGRMYFIVPWKGMMFAGTGHAPWRNHSRDPHPTREQLNRFCSDLNHTLPGIDLEENDIIHVFAGLQSAKKEGGTDFAKRDVYVRHADMGGPEGLHSISGIKFTTARKVAEKTIHRLFPAMKNNEGSLHSLFPPPPDATRKAGIYDFNWSPVQGARQWKEELAELILKEAVVHLDDLILRRTSLGDNPARAMSLAPTTCGLFDWNNTRKHQEIERLHNHFQFLQGNAISMTISSPDDLMISNQQERSS